MQKLRRFLSLSIIAGSLIVPVASFAQPPPFIPGDPAVHSLRGFYGVVCVATQWVLVFGLIIGVLFIIYGGVKYIISGGDERKASDAKKTIITAIVGVVFLLLAIVIVRVVASFFGATLGTGFNITTCPSIASAPSGAPGGGGAPPGSCGDGTCDSAAGEDSTTCLADCPVGGGGLVPPPPPPPPGP